jgi:hypothetical protein
MPYVRLSKHIFDNVECCGVGPLQIIEEQRERVFRPRKATKESAEYKLEAALRVLRRESRDRGLLSDD